VHQTQISEVQQLLAELQTESDQLCQTDPELLNVAAQQLRQDLFAIEAETYVEFMRSGRLNQELPCLLDPMHSQEA
jgi:CPA1 family monovalent cation:H+ antiporter